MSLTIELFLSAAVTFILLWKWTEVAEEEEDDDDDIEDDAEDLVDEEEEEEEEEQEEEKSKAKQPLAEEVGVWSRSRY